MGRVRRLDEHQSIRKWKRTEKMLQGSGILHLVSEPEVQTAVPRICCRLEIMRLFLRRHGIPNLGTLLVLPDIVRFHGRIQDEAVERADGDENRISSTICSSPW